MKPENIRIIVSKFQKQLTVFAEDQCLYTFPIGIGKNPQGNKYLEGDLKTPVGEYEICVKNPKSKFTLSLGLNYPNKLDAKKGYDLGLITKEIYTEICQAIDNQKIPPWKTAMGGEIYIHGHLEKRNWSEGCIRMFDPDIETLYKIVDKGTKVLISP